MRQTDIAPARDVIAYWVLVELRAVAARAKSPAARMLDRGATPDRTAPNGLGPGLGQVRTM